MKLKRVSILIVLLLVFLTGCSSDDASTYKSEIAGLEQQVADLTNELEAVKKENADLKNENSRLQFKVDTFETETVVQDNDIEVIILEKNNLEVNYDANRYSPCIGFVFEVKNNTDKDIKGIQGVIDFKDMFGVSILSLNLDFTNYTIPAGSSIIEDGLQFEINEFMDDHVKLYTTELDGLLFEYHPKTLLFTDGTSKTN